MIRLRDNEKGTLLYIMNKNYETLKEYETLLEKIFPNRPKKYVTHYGDLERLIQDNVPNVVLLDGDSPYGLITAKKIKKENKNIKIILSSSKDNVALDAYQNGIDGYLKKPFTVETIKKILETIQ